MKVLLLLFISLLPVAILLFVIYKLDKFQKEPIKSLIKAFLGGAIIALIFTFILSVIIEAIYPSENQSIWFHTTIMVGFVEELSKFLVFMIFIWRDKNFDEYFDGIVYASFIGLGFACSENIGYVLSDGLGTGISRAMTAVPGHCLDGVILGFFLSLAKFRKKRRVLYILIGLTIVIFISHGLWDLICTSHLSGIISFLYFNALYAVMLIASMKFIRQHWINSKSQADLAATNNQKTTDDINPVNS